MVKNLQDKGIEASTKLEFADVYILNSCAVTAESEKKSRQMVAKFIKLNENAKIIITGCASQNNFKQFLEKDKVEVVLGLAGKGNIYDFLDKEGVFIKELPTVYEDNFEAVQTKTRETLKIQER